MDYQHFEQLYAENNNQDYSARTSRLILLRKFLEGTAYNILQYHFGYSTKSSGGGKDNPYEYRTIPLSQRRPCVISTLCGTVVDDAVSFLFGEGRFPKLNFSDELTQKTMDLVLSKSLLPGAMVDVATDGSVGTGVILIKIINSMLYYESLKAEYLTPVFDPSNPHVLIKLTQKYKVLGSDLQAQGYTIKNPKMDYWYMCEWDTEGEKYYIPWCAEDVKDKNFKPRIDNKKTIIHNLGFVPAVWIKNLSGGIGIDGKCTFVKGITTNIQLDYQLSQAGKGLIYSSSPLLFIKQPNLMSNGQITLGEGSIIVGGENSDAKMVEINGDACTAALAYQKVLREIVLENIHGNRSTPDKGTFAHSGKALEMLHHPLILLASRLRVTYGEIGLLNVVKMIMKMVNQKEVIIDGQRIKGVNENASIDLVWPAWFDASSTDKHQDSMTLGELKNSGIISTETAVKNIANQYGIEDIPKEIALIQKEQAEFTKQNAPTVQETFKS